MLKLREWQNSVWSLPVKSEAQILNSLGGVRLRLCRTVASNWLIVRLPDDIRMNTQQWWNDNDKWDRNYLEQKLVPGPLCTAQISHRLTSEWTKPGTSFFATLAYSDLIIWWKWHRYPAVEGGQKYVGSATVFLQTEPQKTQKGFYSGKAVKPRARNFCTSARF
jgi:hypothetical protein